MRLDREKVRRQLINMGLSTKRSKDIAEFLHDKDLLEEDEKPKTRTEVIKDTED